LFGNWRDCWIVLYLNCIDSVGLDEMIKNTYCSANFFDKVILMMIWKLSVDFFVALIDLMVLEFMAMITNLVLIVP